MNEITFNRAQYTAVRGLENLFKSKMLVTPDEQAVRFISHNGLWRGKLDEAGVISEFEVNNPDLGRSRNWQRVTKIELGSRIGRDVLTDLITTDSGTQQHSLMGPWVDELTLVNLRFSEDVGLANVAQMPGMSSQLELLETNFRIPATKMSEVGRLVEGARWATPTDADGLKFRLGFFDAYLGEAFQVEGEDLVLHPTGEPWGYRTLAALGCLATRGGHDMVAYFRDVTDEVGAPRWVLGFGSKFGSTEWERQMEGYCYPAAPASQLEASASLGDESLVTPDFGSPTAGSTFGIGL